MTIALIAHDTKKELMIQFVIAYLGIFSRHYICATAGTAKSVSDATGLKMHSFLPGSQGGAQQVGQHISFNEIDLFIFFRDPVSSKTNEPDVDELLKICDIHMVPVATNQATAEVLIRGLEEGYLDFRNTITKTPH